MTDEKRKELEDYLKKLKAVKRPDPSVTAQIHSLTELLKQK